jgi:hypothetical protein
MTLLILACSSSPTPSPESADSGATRDAPVCLEEPAASPGYALADGDLLDTSGGRSDRKETNPVALADFDGDGDDDLVMADAEAGLWWHENTGDGFARSQLSELTELSSLGVADLEGDGDLDLVAVGREPGVWILWNREGAFEIQELVVDPPVLASIRDASFADADGDGDLDLSLVTTGQADREASWHRLLLNDGQGGFTDGSEMLPEGARVGVGWQALWLDLEWDGDQDLFLLHAEQDKAEPSRLLVQEDGVFVDRTETCDCGRTGSNMGGSLGDVDGDGLLDAYLTNTGPSPLLQNLGDGSFVEVAASLGATTVPSADWMSFGSLWFDRDNDGDLDLLVSTGPMWDQEGGPQVAEQADRLLERTPEGFTDRAPELGLDDVGAGRGLGYGLIDGDLSLDLVVNHRGSASQIWLAECAGRALVVELTGPAPNTFGVGARVEVETSEGTQVRRVDSRAGWASSVHPRAHFGLGEAEVLSVHVTWPDGQVQEVEVPAFPDRRVRVER